MSMNAREYSCKIIEKIWLTPSVMKVRFKPSKPFDFEPGQFLSIYVPVDKPLVVPGSPKQAAKSPKKGKKTADKYVRRAYSFACSPETAKKEGYELCVKYLPDGTGTNYLKSLRVGDSFVATAPYGDFVFHPLSPDRQVLFISTGTGIAPFRSIMTSRMFQENPPANALSLFGARTARELLYPNLFESAGVQPVFAVSRPDKNWTGFNGRVTDYLKTLPRDWPWHQTDFYICGNGEMITEVHKILTGGHGIAESSIHKEAFFTNPAAKAALQEKMSA
ncbi:hypothetical protein K2X30_05280 [bacterium]|jgi:CDP-4-dehydro-6-deoxyglucose reductase|nr:hypothetical protein [bacterium]